MKYAFKIFSFCLLLLIVLAACAPGSTTSPATQAPATEAATEPSGTGQVPVTGADASPTTAPVAFTGPPMEVGATFLYVDGTTIVPVPAGEFTMGKKDGTDNPEHKVTLADYWIYSTEVTNDQYKNCVAAGQCTEPDLKDNQGYSDLQRGGEPVSGVTWDQASTYCGYVHGRLPTEAEWEKAARGPDANIYPWGNDAPSCSLLNFNNCITKTTRVSEYPDGESYYGLFDMAGNVFEWVNDWYDPFYYKNSPAENPTGPETSQKRSLRSSAYNSNPDQVPVSTRFSDLPANHGRDLGFRCVVDDPLYFAPYCQIALVSGLGPNGQPIPGQNSKLICLASFPPIITPLCNKNNNTPYTTIDFSGNPLESYVTDWGGCTLDNGSIYVCYSKTSITVDTSPVCHPSNQPSPASCPAGYQQNGNACEPTQGWVGQCLPGQNFDPINQCCVAGSGSGSPIGLPLYCGAGFSFNPQTQTCDPFKYPPPESFDIPLTGCNPPDNGHPDDGSCDPADPTCNPPPTQPPCRTCGPSSAP